MRAVSSSPNAADRRRRGTTSTIAQRTRTASASLRSAYHLTEAARVHADEYLVDISRADAAALADGARVAALCDDVVAAFGLTCVAKPIVHAFPGTTLGPGGVTALYLLAESHLAVHTWPEKRGALLSLGTCRDGAPTAFPWRDVVTARLGPCDVVVRRVARAIVEDLVVALGEAAE